MAKTKQIAEYGDFQTPQSLAEEVCNLLKRRRCRPATIIEPTCGRGTFLAAAHDSFPSAKLLGVDLNERYVQEARSRVPAAEVIAADFFSTDWTQLLAEHTGHILVLGNPPWVTNAELGALGSKNLPQKSNFQGHRGFDGITGKSNFDISEWMLLRLIESLNGRSATVAMLCKTIVARKVLTHAWKSRLQIRRAEMYGIDALRHFNAAVNACLFLCEMQKGAYARTCTVHDTLVHASSDRVIGLRNDRLVADVPLYDSLRHLEGTSPYRWRSGIKHDCSKVMELTKEGRYYRNGLNERVELEGSHVYPMLKSSELAAGNVTSPRRWMLVTQRSVADDTAEIQHKAPMTWNYLRSHDSRLTQRGSSIYKNRPPYAIFGVGSYTFAPWRVAISGFYKKLTFAVLGSFEGKPIVLDDTSYFIACQTSEEAHYVAALLNSEEARRFYSAFVFWDTKRPIKAEILSLLNLASLARDFRLHDTLLRNRENIQEISCRSDLGTT